MRHLPLQAGSVDGIWCWAALVHLPREAVPQALGEFARIVRSRGSLSMSIAEGDGEGFEVATPYGSDRRRWFTRYREPELTALLTTAGFSIRNVRRHRACRDWLSVHAIRQSAGANGLQRQPTSLIYGGSMAMLYRRCGVCGPPLAGGSSGWVFSRRWPRTSFTAWGMASAPLWLRGLQSRSPTLRTPRLQIHVEVEEGVAGILNEQAMIRPIKLA